MEKERKMRVNLPKRGAKQMTAKWGPPFWREKYYPRGIRYPTNSSHKFLLYLRWALLKRKPPNNLKRGIRYPINSCHKLLRYIKLVVF